MNIKNILGRTPNEKIVRGMTLNLASGAAATGFLATKGITALVAGSALTAATGWGLIALAVAGIALAVFGAIQALRSTLRSEKDLENNDVPHKANNFGKAIIIAETRRRKSQDSQRPQRPLHLNSNLHSILRHTCSAKRKEPLQENRDTAVCN